MADRCLLTRDSTAHRAAGPAARPRRSVRGVSNITGAASTTLVALDMATSGDPDAPEWLVLLVPFYLGLALLAAGPPMVALRLRADDRWAQSGMLAGSLAVLVNVVSSTCPNLLYRLGGEHLAALATLFPAVLAPLLAMAMGLLLAGLFGCFEPFRLGRLRVPGAPGRAGSELPTRRGWPGAAPGCRGPTPGGAFRVPGPMHPRRGRPNIATASRKVAAGLCIWLALLWRTLVCGARPGRWLPLRV